MSANETLSAVRYNGAPSHLAFRRSKAAVGVFQTQRKRDPAPLCALQKCSMQLYCTSIRQSRHADLTDGRSQPTETRRCDGKFTSVNSVITGFKEYLAINIKVINQNWHPFCLLITKTLCIGREPDSAVQTPALVSSFCVVFMSIGARG
jgi:hypothetical protein